MRVKYLAGKIAGNFRPGVGGGKIAVAFGNGRAGLDRQRDRRTTPDRRPGPRKSRTGTGGPNRAGPARQEDRHGNRTAPDGERSQPEDRTGSTAEMARADGLHRWTKAGDGQHQHQGQDRTGARGDAGELLPGELKRRLKTGAPNSARQEAGTASQPRRRGFMRTV